MTKQRSPGKATFWFVALALRCCASIFPFQDEEAPTFCVRHFCQCRTELFAEPCSFSCQMDLVLCERRMVIPTLPRFKNSCLVPSWGLLPRLLPFMSAIEWRNGRAELEWLGGLSFVGAASAGSMAKRNKFSFGTYHGAYVCTSCKDTSGKADRAELGVT